MGRNNRNLIISLLILAASLVAVTIVLADYIGPDRTTTTTVWSRLQCSYLAEHDEPGPGGYFACTLILYNTPSAGCPSSASIAGYFTASACGWPASCSGTWFCSISGSSSTEGCSPGDSGCEGSTQTITQPPATISGLISCGTPGTSGWCRSAAFINLNGSEPLSGYDIIALEGTRNGVTFGCGGSSCNVNLLEGQNDFTYWALSSWGDSSEMGSASGKVDTQAPTITGGLSGTSGDNGWYVSAVTVSASASDSTSGLQSFDINIDGGGYQTYSGDVILGEGTHTIDLRAVDNAGHQIQVSQSFSVDTTTPVLGLSGGESFCPGCGDRLPLSYHVQDGLSGVSQWWLSVGGEVITSGSTAETGVFNWEGSGLGGGNHTLTLSARDSAGNLSATSLAVTLNTPLQSEPTSSVLTMPRASIVTPLPLQPTSGSSLDPGLAQSKPSQFTFVSAQPEQQASSIQSAQQVNSVESTGAQATASLVLWGGAAAGLIGAATYMALDAQRKRKEEEQRMIQELARINANLRAREKGYKSYADQVEQERKAAQDVAFLTAFEAEQRAKTEREAIDDELENEEKAWEGKKMAQDEAMFGKGMRKPKTNEPPNLTNLAAGGIAIWVQKEYEKPAKVIKENKPWWQKAWERINSYFQEKIGSPVQKTWTQYVYKPVIQPVTHWWKKDVPVWMKETTISLIPVIGDGWGLLRQGSNWLQKKSVDKLDVILSLVGLIFDIPWPQEGILGGDVVVAVMRGMNAAIPPGPARDVMTQLVQSGLKNPDQMVQITKTSEELLKNDRLLQALIDNPQALETVMRYGPEAVEILSKNGDEAVELTGRFGDKAIKYLLGGGKDSFENLKFLNSLSGSPERVLQDLTSGSKTSVNGAQFQLEQLKRLDPATISGVEVTIPGGRVDAILKDGTIIEYKSWDWYGNAYQNPVQLQQIQKDLVKQIQARVDYQKINGINAPIKIVFKSGAGMPESVKKAIESIGAIVEVP